MKRCTKCMEELTEGVRFCPNCGFEQDSAAQPPNALKRGTMLHDRYYIGNVIGQGGFGITYVGWDVTLEMKVAVKEYFPSGSASRTNSFSNQIQWDFTGDGKANWSEGMDRFLKEARKMAKLDSVPAIVRVRDAFGENQTAYIVMDFVEGDTLKKYLLSHGVLRHEECMALLSPILDSLAVIHDRGFIHRDISPDNIMLQPDGSARLLDMGAAVDIRANDGHASMAVVKRNFSAPEQYMEAESLGSWTDVYAMAATFYYCLTGKVAPEALEREFKKTPLYFDPGLNIPAHVIGALSDGLELDAKNRIQDMREFKRRLTVPVDDIAPTMPFQGETKSAPTPAIEETLPTGQPEQKIENSTIQKKTELSRFGRLKRGLKIALITIGALSAMSVLTIFFYAFHDSGSGSSGGGEETKTARVESSAAKETAEKTTVAESDSVEETDAPKPVDTSTYVEVELSDLIYEKTEDENGIALTQYLGEGEPYIKLPDEIEGLPVVTLGMKLFSKNDTLEGVLLPAGLKTIENSVFSGCMNIQRLDLPEGVTYIGDFAFWPSGIERIYIPSTVEELHGGSTILNIPEFDIAPENRKYIMSDGMVYKSTPDGIELTASPYLRDNNFVIPTEISVIGDSAFMYHDLTELTIPGSVQTVGDFAFSWGDSLRRVVIEEGVEKLKDGCFCACGSLSEVMIPQSVKYIGYLAFDECDKLKSVTVSRDCEIVDGAFAPDVEINYYD